MNKVPKCKDCRYCHTFEYPSGLHYRQCKYNEKPLKGGSRSIAASEYRTSPKWCSLRNK